MANYNIIWNHKKQILRKLQYQITTIITSLYAIEFQLKLYTYLLYYSIYALGILYLPSYDYDLSYP